MKEIPKTGETEPNSLFQEKLKKLEQVSIMTKEKQGFKMPKVSTNDEK